MGRLSRFIIMLLIVLSSCLGYQVMVYRQLVPRLVWSVNRLYLNVAANRQAWMACKRYRWCEDHETPRWQVVRTAEAKWTM